MARWAAFINRQKQPEANWLTVDAGNYVDRAGSQGGCSRKCQFMVTSYEGLHYDVLNIAKQEVSMGYETLRALKDTTQDVAYVSANLIDVAGNRPLFDPYTIKDYGNMRVGVLGLLRPEDFPASSRLIDSTELRTDPYLEAAAKYIPELRRKADAIVVLAELPTADVEALVQAYPDIDLVISTGALKSGETMVNIGTTQVVGTGSSGYNGHWVSMEFDPAWGDSVVYDSFRDQLTDNYEEEGVWADRLAAFEGKPQAAEPKVHSTSAAEIEKSRIQTSKEDKREHN